jgi:hypothetical protein
MATNIINRDRAVAISPIRSKDDLPEAIQAAADDPSIRWYVERRVTALRASDEFKLPWRNR